jgi:hypothetical protein
MKILISEIQLKSLSEKIKVNIEKGMGASFDWEEGDISKYPKMNIPLKALHPNQPIEDEKEKEYQDKVDDIISKYQKNKSLMPIMVHKMKRGYKIIDGHHRWTALRQMGKKTAKCIVVPSKDVKYVKDISESQIMEQGWTDPVKAASGPQKCGLTKGGNDGSYEKECRALDKEAQRQDAIDAKERARNDKNFLSLSYDRDSFPLDRQSKKDYYRQYQEFMNSNPGVLNSGDGLNTEQKYALISKVLDFVRNVPQISYSVNLRSKYGLNKQSSLMDVIDVVGKMGGYQSFISWMNAGGPKLN